MILKVIDVIYLFCVIKFLMLKKININMLNQIHYKKYFDKEYFDKEKFIELLKINSIYNYNDYYFKNWKETLILFI